MLTRQIREYFNNVKKDGQSIMLGHGEQIIMFENVWYVEFIARSCINV